MPVCLAAVSFGAAGLCGPKAYDDDGATLCAQVTLIEKTSVCGQRGVSTSYDALLKAAVDVCPARFVPMNMERASTNNMRWCVAKQ
jgi:hypothetical protein